MADKKKVFLLGGQDTEMQQIKKTFDENDIPYIDKGLSRGAKIADYADEIRQLISEGKQPVAIELPGAGEGEYADVEVIDHHGIYANNKASILQILDLLGLKPTKDEEMIAAIDAGGPKAMLRTGFSKEDVIGESTKVFDSQNITKEMVTEAELARGNREIIGDITIIKMSHSKCAPLHRLHPGEYEGLVVISGDGEVNIFDNKNLIREIEKKFLGGWDGGDGLFVDTIPTCYWGGKPNVDELEMFVREYLNTNKEQTPEVINEGTLSIKGLATALGMSEELVKLPNGKEVMSLVWKPEHLSQVFELIDKSEAKKLLGKNDVVTIDGVCPTRLLPTISHALHPVATAVSYPQGGPDVKLPLSGCSIEHEGHAEGVKFGKVEDEEKTSITFELTSPSIDVVAALQSLVAPEITEGKPVCISGRGPVAIATALAEAYAHRVPFVTCFQPGTGNVVCISHSDVALGTILA